MKRLILGVTFIAALTILAFVSRCGSLTLPIGNAAPRSNTGNDRRGFVGIVGAWIVTIPDAPFPLHMFVFHSDGTVEQSNPDAGDPSTSDSNLMGAWREIGDEYRGKMVEVTADRTTRQFASRGEISFELKVSGNTFDGTASATFFDASGRQIRGPVQVRMEGERVYP